ncbi:hydrogenase iron-sulfur subunit [Candidatus Fermentibacteria bacterium]|nr:hydrogenase iron-sulfur subunit [Candidatus Fermentibacteria bacterium]
MSEDPRIVVFCCNWSIYPGLQLSAIDENPDDLPGVSHIVSMCSGRVSPELVIEAFVNGAWGVMLAGCPTDECEHDGNYKTRKRFIMLRKVLEEFGIEPGRISMDWFSTGEVAKLKQSVREFVDRITEMGPARVVKEQELG